MTSFIREKLWTIYFPLSLVYLEAALKLWCFGAMTIRGAIFTLLFSLAAGAFGTFLCSLGSPKFTHRAMGILLFLCTLLYGTQAVYFKIFKAFLALYSLGGAGAVIGNFWREALTGIWRSSPAVLAVFFPFVLWLIVGKKLAPESLTRKTRLRALIAALLLQISAVAAVMSSTEGVMSAAYLYVDTYVPELSVSYFGVLTNLELDVVSLIRPEAEEVADAFGSSSAQVTAPPAATPEGSGETAEPTETPVVYGDNVLEIDWESLIGNEANATLRSMDEYFSQREPTSQNEYTGYFEGKNLIWIVAEGFSSWALDETHTPTLYKLANAGFVFENFYNPIWYVSTSDGEYTTLLSLLPRSGVWSMSRSSDNYLPFAMGNLLGGGGYACYAFHNGTYTYYDRNLSHPNLGYTWLADGNGLQVTNVWPPSDVEMIENSVDYYIGSEPFHAYYMTISGHMYYTFSGNMMAAKHEDAVSDLPYSANARAYVACQMELDRAVETLIGELDAKGVLDDTVIVLSGDHYPYALETGEIGELNGGPVEQNFELYRTTLIMWCADMEEPVYVDKYCCSLDVLPTLCNLFGLPYDSRLLMGSDVFSDAPALIVFGNRSFITDYGRYNAATDVFTPGEGVVWGDGGASAYAQGMLSEVGRMFTMSNNILDYDYYEAVLGGG